MPTKTKLLHDAAEYGRRSMESEKAAARRDYTTALATAVEALEYLDGKLQYAKKYGGEPQPRLGGLEIIFQHAPRSFNHQSLSAVERWLDVSMRAERAYGPGLRERLVKAQDALDTAIDLWNLIERGECSSQSLDEDQQDLVSGWIAEGVVEKSGAKYQIALRWDARWWGKCEQCGAPARDCKVQFLSVRRCSQCKGVENFVLVGPAT